MSAANQLREAAGVPSTKQKAPAVQFREFLEKGKSQIAAALPSHLTPDRIIRLATTEFAKNAQLQKCDQVSVFGAIVQASQLGLEIGVLGQAYLVPFRNNKTNRMEAQFIPGYKGLISLARRSGEVTSIETHIVYENDEFDLQLGIDSDIKHKPFLDGDRGKPRLVYGVAKFKDGGHHMEWMSIADVNKIKARSKAASSGPWVTDYEQMVRKTLIRRMMNYLPMSIELANAVQVSDAADEGKKASIEGDFVVIHDEDAVSDLPQQPEAKQQPIETVDIKTGEIINDEESPEDAIYNDAIEAAQKGDFDLALDLSRDLTPHDRKIINSEIEKFKQAQEQAAAQTQTTTRTRATRSNMGGIE